MADIFCDCPCLSDASLDEHDFVYLLSLNPRNIDCYPHAELMVIDQVCKVYDFLSYKFNYLRPGMIEAM